MKVHHLDCGSMCPWAGKLAPSVFPSDIACHCLLIETDAGLILIDTGLGTRDLENPRRLGAMSYLLGVRKDPALAAVRQVEELGFAASDVRHLIPTHLDLDHAGGIPDFPNAEVHTLRAEYEAATSPRTIEERNRYRRCHIGGDVKWAVHDVTAGERWFGFEAVRDLPGIPPEVLLVPLGGHSPGHFGVAVQGEDGWQLHAGDAYYDRAELDPDGDTIWGWTLFQKLAHTDYALARANQARLGELDRARDDVTVFCAHDRKGLP